MRVLLSIFVLVSLLNAKCYKISCVGTINQTKQQAIMEIEEAYKQNMQAQQELEEKYREYNEILKIQNDLLLKIQKVKEDSLFQDKAINFLMTQQIKLKSNEIDTENTNDFKEGVIK